VTGDRAATNLSPAGNVVSLVDSASSTISGVGTGGPLQDVARGATPVADVSAAPIHLDQLGASVAPARSS
jgi:hypothetical protein